MKKSQLKKIIKESIKQLMTEQSGSSCIQNQQAMQSVSSNPQLGDGGITQNFINNMQGKPYNFYQVRGNVINQKIQSLAGGYPSQGGFLTFCQGENPMWQAKLTNKLFYIQNCMQNPGTC